MKKILLYILFKKVPEQSGNIMILYATFIFLEISTNFSMILLTSRLCYCHGKENSREFQTFPENSMTIHF